MLISFIGPILCKIQRRSVEKMIVAKQDGYSSEVLVIIDYKIASAPILFRSVPYVKTGRGNCTEYKYFLEACS